MHLAKANVVQALKVNFGFDTLQDEQLGEMVVMSPRDAFVYSAVTGHAYLDPGSHHFSPNGLMPIFNQANSYHLVTGMFDRDGNLRHSPINLAEERPFIARGEKYVLPVEYDTNASLNARLAEVASILQRQGKDPRDHLVCRIKKSTVGYSMEPFMEYVATRYFNGLGMLTETQIPFFYSGGTPDFAAYSLPDIGKALRQHLAVGGASFIELASMRLFPESARGQAGPQAVETIVGEAKTGAATGMAQLEKYLRSGVFSKAYEIIPHKAAPEVAAGLLTLGDDCGIRVHEAKKPAMVSSSKQGEYLKWLTNYVKYFVVANLRNEELDEVYGRMTGRSTRTVGELILFINSLPLEEISGIVSERINGQ